MGGIAQTDIHLILNKIEHLEQTIAAGELDIEDIQNLTTLYQKGIEYYSAFDNVMFTDLLYRMQSLLQRDDINIILNSVQEVEKILPAENNNQKEEAKIVPEYEVAQFRENDDDSSKSGEEDEPLVGEANSNSDAKTEDPAGI